MNTIQTINGHEIVIPKWLWLILVGAVGWAVHQSVLMSTLVAEARHAARQVAANQEGVKEVRDRQLEWKRDVESIPAVKSILQEHEARLKAIEEK